MPDSYQLRRGFILGLPTLIQMSKPDRESFGPSDMPESHSQPGTPNTEQELADLATALRGTMTPVVGYLELISDERQMAPSEQRLQWIATIERRLEAMRELNDQVARICGVLRDSVSGPESVNGHSEATRREPSAPEG